MVFAYHQSVDHFLFCPLSRKENIFLLSALCGFAVKITKIGGKKDGERDKG
jgi:hypothetical protein